MSLVGPRPCLPNQIEVIEARRRHGVYDVRPGITGTAQLAGVDMSTPKKLALADHDYVQNRSFLGDMTIIISSVFGVGSGDAIKH